MTLIELTVVLLILISLATIAIRSTAGLQDQARWEQTKNRYAEIKKAIIGDPKLIINGQPDISGFVADMGRLPKNIHELLEKDYCEDDYRITVDHFDDALHATAEAECNATYGAGKWIIQTGWNAPTATTLGYGWNGPYLLSSQPAYDSDAFVDGWGRLAQANIDQNYGWGFCLGDDPKFSAMNTNCYANAPATAGTAQLNIKSFGKDATNDHTTAPAGDYEKDFPEPIMIGTDTGLNVEMIRKEDWQVSLDNGVSVILHPEYNGSCSVEFTSSTCEIAGGTWFGTCNEITHPSRYTCDLFGKIWIYGECTDGVSLDKSSCDSASAAWTTACSDNTSLDKATCEAASETWEPCPNSVPSSKSLCEAVNGIWTFPPIDIVLTITYRSGTGTIATATSEPITISENGREQIISFSGFKDSLNNSVTRIPMGRNNLIVTKSGTDDIYPPSCLGLSGDVGSNGTDDCTDAGGSLLSNGLCDDITPAECIAGADGATGTLIRNTLKIPFIPHKPLPTINW